jgi:hypothetical protein
VYSALPDVLFSNYGVRTEISLQSELRSEEIKDFVWGHNPHISFSTERGNIIHAPKFSKYKNYNEVLLALFGADGHELFSTYYEPVVRPELADKVVCDLTFGPSGTLNGYREKKFWDAVLKYMGLRFRKEDLVFLNPSAAYPSKELMCYVKDALDVANVMPVRSLRELTDCIFSARSGVFLDSGAKSIAAAYKKPAIILDRRRENNFFRYPMNAYVVLEPMP